MSVLKKSPERRTKPLGGGGDVRGIFGALRKGAQDALVWRKSDAINVLGTEPCFGKRGLQNRKNCKLMKLFKFYIFRVIFTEIGINEKRR